MYLLSGPTMKTREFYILWKLYSVVVMKLYLHNHKVDAYLVTLTVPPLTLEVELQQIHEIVEARPFKERPDSTFSYFFIRLNTIADEDDNSVLLELNETFQYIVHVNEQNILTDDISLMLSIVPGIRNMSMYLANLDEIGRIAASSPGIVRQVLLDFSNTDIGLFDREEIVKRWHSCNHRGQIGQFACGFIFDGRLCPVKVSIFEVLSAHIPQRFLVVINIRMFPRDDEYAEKFKMVLSICGFAAINKGLNFFGFMDDSIVQINQNDHRAWSVKTARLENEPVYFISLTSLNFTYSPDKARALEMIESNMTKFSELSTNISIPLIVSIEPEPLHLLIASKKPFVPSSASETSEEFLDLFHNFLVPLDGGDNYNVSKIYSSVLEYVAKRNSTHNPRNLSIFIAFTPITNIQDELLSLLQDVQRINALQFKAVRMIFLDYNQLRVTTGLTSVIQSDLRLCQELGKNFSIPFGFIFSMRNCIPKYKDFLRIFPRRTYILFRGYHTYFDECYKNFPDLRIGQIAQEATKTISVNFSSSTFSINSAAILSAQIQKYAVVHTVYIEYEDEDIIWETTDVPFATEEWFYSKTSFSSENIGYSLSHLDLKLIQELCTNHAHTIMLDADAGVDQGYPYLPHCISKDVNRRVMITFALVNSDPGYIQTRVSAFFKGLDRVASESRKNIQDIVFDWGMCFDNESCGSRDILEYTSTHFDVLSSVINYTSDLYRNKIEKISIIVPLQLLTILPVFFIPSNIVESWQNREQNISRAKYTDEMNKLSQINATFNLVDAVIIQQEISVNLIVTKDINIAFSSTVQIFEVALSLVKKIKRGTRKDLESILKVTIYGCNELNSTTSQLKYIRFWELLSNWANKMDNLVIMDSNNQPVNHNDRKCSVVGDPTKPMERKCGCGWWIYDEDSKRYISRKAMALVEHQRSRKSYENTLATYQPTHLVTLLLVVLIAMIFSLALAVTIMYLVRRSRKKTFFQEILAKVSEDVKKRKVIARDELSMSDVIGRGESGTTIFRGSYKQRTSNAVEVAVKVWKAPNGMKLQNVELHSLRNLISEANLLEEIGEHANIIKLVGLCTSRIYDGEVQLVLKFCPFGCLLNYLRENQVDLSLNAVGHDVEITLIHERRAEWVLKMVNWTLDIVSGLEYLTSKSVVHADIAARNILLDQTMVCKLTDFGMSRKLDSNKVYMKRGPEPLPWRWMAPESLQIKKFNEKTDVWMFGVTIWEIFSFGEVPFGGFSWSSEFTGMFQRGLQLDIPELMFEDMATLVKSCWNINCEERPTFTSLKESLTTFHNIH